MSKTVRFDIESNEPSGTTFAGNKFPKLAGATNTKRKANFGIDCCEPQGVTFQGNKSHINMPSANKAPKETKDLSSSSGTYKANRKGPQDFGGSIAVGKSSPK